jgi:tryptophan-rich sensory protein
LALKNVWKLLLAIAVCELAGIIGGVFTAPAIPVWYDQLFKPPLNPPSWLFGPVWFTLYFLMGIALFLVWRAEWQIKRPLIVAKRKAWNPLTEALWSGRWQKANLIGVFIVQWLLNVCWSVIFFGLQNPGAAFFALLALWVAIIYVMVNFYRVSQIGAWLLAPYLLWVTFAAYLNFGIWVLN